MEEQSKKEIYDFTKFRNIKLMLCRRTYDGEEDALCERYSGLLGNWER